MLSLLFLDNCGINLFKLIIIIHIKEKHISINTKYSNEMHFANVLLMEISSIVTLNINTQIYETKMSIYYF